MEDRFRQLRYSLLCAVMVMVVPCPSLADAFLPQPNIPFLATSTISTFSHPPTIREAVDQAMKDPKEARVMDWASLNGYIPKQINVGGVRYTLPGEKHLWIKKEHKRFPDDDDSYLAMKFGEQLFFVNINDGTIKNASGETITVPNVSVSTKIRNFPPAEDPDSGLIWEFPSELFLRIELPGGAIKVDSNGNSEIASQAVEELKLVAHHNDEKDKGRLNLDLMGESREGQNLIKEQVGRAIWEEKGQAIELKNMTIKSGKIKSLDLFWPGQDDLQNGDDISNLNLSLIFLNQMLERLPSDIELRLSDLTDTSIRTALNTAWERLLEENSLVREALPNQLYSIGSSGIPWVELRSNLSPWNYQLVKTALERAFQQTPLGRILSERGFNSLQLNDQIAPDQEVTFAPSEITVIAKRIPERDGSNAHLYLISS